MNDDFLHRIRTEPPEDFLARLKSRLDKQLAPPKRTRRASWLRGLASGLVFGGSVFAITLLTVNGVPENIRAWVTSQHDAQAPNAVNNASQQAGQTDHAR